MTWGNWNTGRKASALRAPTVIAACLLAWALLAPGGAMAGNTVDINDSDAYTHIFGNYNGQGSTQTGSDPTGDPASDNNLTVTGAIVSGDVVGGQAYGGTYTGSADAGTNTVTISGGTFSNSGVFGGYTGITGGNANGNTVNVNALTGTLRSVVGGTSAQGNANSNTVTVNAGAIQNIIGGSSNTGTADNNTVIVKGGTISGSIRGGNGKISANSNNVTIDAAFTGTIGVNIYGGTTTGAGSATGNTVTINTSGWTFSGDIYGGTTNGWGDVFTGNTLNLAAGNTLGSVYNMNIVNFTSAGNAGIATLDTTPTGAAGTPKVTLNTNAHNVAFGGTVTGTGGIDKTGTGVLTLSGTNSYSGDTAISGGGLTVTGTLGSGNYAGAIANSGTLIFDQSAAQTLSGVISGTGSLSKNGAGVLILTGANTYSGDTTVSGGGLTVTGTLGSGAYAGAIANSGALTFNQSAAQTLSGVISGTGSLAKNGAYVLTLSGVNTYSGGTTVNGGTLALTGSLANSVSLALYDTAIFDFSSSAASSPQALKTLSVYGQGSTIKANAGGADFSGGNLNFFVPSTATGNTPLLTVDGSADITGATAHLTYQSVRPNIALGQSLTLLSATALTADQTGLVVQTASGDVYTLQVQNNQLWAVLQSISATSPQYERLKAFAEGRAASLAFVNQGADLILNQGMDSALLATSGPGFSFNAFAAGQGGWSRYDTGSHVDISGASMLAGLGIGNGLGIGRLTAGLFFEGGWGSYDSYNSFSNYASVKGDGNTNYYGGGILGRYDITQGPASGLYFDASARMGRVSANFGSSDIKYNGSKADFDTSAPYYGAHAGLGYQWSFTEKAMLDLSGKLIWTHQGSDDVTVHDDEVRFKDANSLRTRLGGRFNYAVCDYATPYVGAHWEHEFDGRQRSSVNGVDIGSPSLKGDTGVGELGLTLRPVKDSGFSIDLGVQGYVGKREGVTGSLQAKYEF